VPPDPRGPEEGPIRARPFAIRQHRNRDRIVLASKARPSNSSCRMP